MATVEQLETIRELALLNLHMIATYAPMDISAERTASNETVARTNIAILDYLDSLAGCPTCPYLDSLEDEEPDCECEEEEGEEADDQEAFIADILGLLDGAYVPSLGTRIVFCRN